MNTKKIYTIMAVFAIVFAGSAIAAYDVIAVDVVNNEITRMDVEGNIVWQKPLGNSYVDAAVGPDGNIYVGDNANRRVQSVGAWSGERNTYFTDGSRCIALAFGPDYNGDGTSDLYVAGEGRIAVVGGPGNGNAGKLLATNSSIITLNAVSLVFGPDETGDGNSELYVVDGDQNKVFVVDGMDITDVVRDFDVNIALLQGAQIIGDKLYYGDANTSTRNFVAWYYLDGSSTGVTRVLEYPVVDYPRYFEVAADGLIYMPNRYATYTDNPSVDVYDSDWNYVRTLYQKEGANFASVTFVPVETGFKDFFLADGNANNKLYKYNHFGDLLWEADGFRSVGNMTLGPDGRIYTFRSGTDRRIDAVNPEDGSIIKTFFSPSQSPVQRRAYDGVFAYDYNGDGIVDLYALTGNISHTWADDKVTVTEFSTLKVISGPGAADEGEVLATVDNLIAGMITVGPDVAGTATQQDPNTPDGIGELYLAYAANQSNTPRGMYIIEPSTLRIVKSYTQQRDPSVPDYNALQPAWTITGMAGFKFGPDGYLYAGSHFNQRIARFRIVSDDDDISIERFGIGNDYFFVDSNRAPNPSGIAFANEKMYLSNRYTVGTNQLPGDATIINGDATLNGIFATSPDNGRFDTILVMDAQGCPVDYPADLNGDCFVDAADLSVFAQDWLICTDPVIENCP